MKLDQLTLSHFRNYEDLDISFGDGLTLLTGDNAQGKTNLLEAIFLLSLAKSHRTHQDKEMVQWGQEAARVQGRVARKDYTLPLEVSLSKAGKTAKVNGLTQAKLSHFIGKLNVVLFAPDDLQLVKGPPGLRRGFLDTELGQAYPVYLSTLVHYNHTLKQRNRYLKDFGQSNRFDKVYFQVVTEDLVQAAATLVRYRTDFVTRLEALAQPIHSDLSRDRDQLTLTYQASHRDFDYQDINSLSDQFLDRFRQAQSRERDQATTLYGPHRDDIHFFINGQKSQDYASQGQQRSIVLAIKLAELDLLYQLLGDYPVLLLDDVLSELDLHRQHQLLGRIQHNVQTFLTTATLEGIDLDLFEDLSILEIHQGQVEAIK